ncbi:MAG: T9SS type A sorting domain-containing protein [Bacteroidota bacterium]|nr:T9SS type A sorting domain-containing protein [Bacteroidota bacterium]
MKYKLLFFVLSFFIGHTFTFAQEKSFDAYKAEVEGYFINFMETPFGIIATDNYASAIYLLKDGEKRILFSSPGCGRYMTLSPDKKSIGFKYIQADGKQAPALIAVQTKEITMLHSPVALCGQVSFSQNGKMAFTIGNELVVKNGNTLSNHLLPQYVNIVPISPNGNLVCFNDDHDQLFLLDLLTEQTTEVTFSKKGNMFPRWSPDGSKLMYSSISGGLHVYDITTQETAYIAEGQYASWKEDSEHIIFTKMENTDLELKGADIYSAKWDGSEIINITNTPGDYEIAAVPSGNRIIYQNLNQKTVNCVSTDAAARTSGQLLFSSQLPLSISKQNFQNSVQAITTVPGTVPYINQVYDTPEWHYGYGSCAATSAIMAIAYYNKLPKWPITTSNGVGNHNSDYGAYVADRYTSNEYYFQDVSTTGGGENSWGGYGYMWTGSYSPHSRMRQYITDHYVNSVQEDADNYAKVLTQINSGYPFPVCNLLSSAGHLTLAVGYVNGQHTIIFNDPYGNKNNGAWPNWNGQNAYYDWPGYNNGYQNLNTVAWTVTTEGTEITYNDTIIDDVFYDHGFYVNNSTNGSHQRYFHDLNAGYNNHYWYTGTEASTTDICHVTWTPTIATAGDYEIKAYIPGGTGCTAVNANYKIYHSGGTTTVAIDQTQNGGQWVSLGTYNLLADQSSYVYLGDGSSVASQNIAFDAMKFTNVTAIDNVVPTTQISSANNWKTGNFTANFTDVDDMGGSGIAKSYYQVQDFDGTEWYSNSTKGFLTDKFNSYNSSMWSVPASSGNYQVGGGNLIQTDSSVSNTNVYTSLDQNLSNQYLYQFTAMMDPATYSTSQHRFGFHFFSDNAALPNRGNSYFIFFRKETNVLEFYKVVNDVYTLSNSISNVTTNFSQWYDYKIVFDRTTGKMEVYRDNVFLGAWTDPNVLITQGNYVSFRTGNCKLNVNELNVFRSRSPSVTVNVGAASINEIRYQNPDPLTNSGLIRSIVKDVAGNLSAITEHAINVDWTDPSCSNVNDGAGSDIDTIASATTLSANWIVSLDQNSGISKYWYAIGTNTGGTDVLNWTDNTTNASVTNSSLTLTPGQVYYLSVKTENAAGLTSICNSDGILVESPVGINKYEDVVSFVAKPNPFNESSTILFSQKKEGNVCVSLIDMLGKEIIISNNNYSSGNHSVTINSSELNLSAGIYTVKFLSEGRITSMRLVKY